MHTPSHEDRFARDYQYIADVADQCERDENLRALYETRVLQDINLSTYALSERDTSTWSDRMSAHDGGSVIGVANSSTGDPSLSSRVTDLHSSSHAQRGITSYVQSQRISNSRLGENLNAQTDHQRVDILQIFLDNLLLQSSTAPNPDDRSEDGRSVHSVCRDENCPSCSAFEGLPSHLVRHRSQRSMSRDGESLLSESYSVPSVHSVDSRIGAGVK